MRQTDTHMWAEIFLESMDATPPKKWKKMVVEFVKMLEERGVSTRASLVQSIHENIKAREMANRVTIFTRHALNKNMMNYLQGYFPNTTCNFLLDETMLGGICIADGERRITCSAHDLLERLEREYRENGQHTTNTMSAHFNTIVLNRLQEKCHKKNHVGKKATLVRMLVEKTNDVTGMGKAIVMTAYKQGAPLEKELQNDLTGYKVEFQEHKELIGGLLISMFDRRVQGTVKAQLQSLRQKFQT